MSEMVIPPDPNEEAYVTVHRGDLIALDLDNVVFEFIERTLDMWRLERPDAPDYGREQIDHYDVGHDLESTDYQMFRDFWQRPGFFRDLEPIPGVVQAAHEMRAERLDVIFCSSPLVNSASETTCHSNKIDRLKEVFGIWAAENCHLGKDKTIVRADVLIDDKPVVGGRYKPFWQHVYFDQPYNRHHNMDKHRVPREGRGIARIIDWKDWRKTIRLFSR